MPDDATPRPDNTVLTMRLNAMLTPWSEARREAARLSNALVALHKYIRRRSYQESQRISEPKSRRWRWPSQGQLEKHFKGKFALHSQSVQAMIKKFCANVDGTRTKRRNGDHRARYPWRDRRHFVTVPFKRSAIRRKGPWLSLSMGAGRQSLRFRLPGLPSGVRIVAVELGAFAVHVTVQHGEMAETLSPTIQRLGALDPGLIYTGVVTDGNDSLAVSGRGLRSATRRYNKKTSHIRRLQGPARKDHGAGASCRSRSTASACGRQHPA